MKQTLLLLPFFFIPAIGFAQTEKMLSGKVVSDDKALANIDIVNMDSKKSVTTDLLGNYTIPVKANDMLFIISKEYYDRKIVVAETDLQQNNLTIIIEKKPIELEDVTITRVKSMKIKVSQADLNNARLYKEANTPKVLGVYDGTTPGINFMALGGQLMDMFSSKDRKKPEKAAPLPEFKEYIRATFADSFFIRELKLKTDEIGLFVSFCEADPKAENLVKTNDNFESMNFLIIKVEDFKKRNSAGK